MTLDFSRCRRTPFAHQREDVAWLIRHPYALIASEMRTGKTKIVIDAAQFMFEAGTIDRMIVVAPEPVVDVWVDPQLGQLADHLWPGLPAHIIRYHTEVQTWWNGGQPAPANARRLEVYGTNYEFLRRRPRLDEMLKVCGPRTFLVADESSFLKNHKSDQTEAFVKMRHRCGRVVLLNGTPIFHTPLDLFSQGNILHPSILECKYITQYKARYAIMEPVLGFGGEPIKRTIVKGKFKKDIIIERTAGWTNLEDLQRRFAPYTVRRMQADCLDLPPKLEPVILTARLKESWPHYQQMKRDLVIWLSASRVALSPSSAVKVMRLAQITSGFVGGIEDAGIEDDEPSLTDDVPAIDITGGASWDEMLQTASLKPETVAQVVGREKLDILHWFIEQQLEADPNLHVVVWCRFRDELFRMMAEVAERWPMFERGAIYGAQPREDRRRALLLLKPETSPKGPVFVGGIIGTGSYGLDFTAAHTCVTMSDVYSPGRSAQTLDRVYGPGQKFPVAYFNIVATGPSGQQTIDHTILAARRTGEDIANWTAAAWVKALSGEGQKAPNS